MRRVGEDVTEILEYADDSHGYQIFQMHLEKVRELTLAALSLSFNKDGFET